MKQINDMLIKGLFTDLKYGRYIILIILFIVGIVLLGRYIYRKLKKED